MGRTRGFSFEKAAAALALKDEDMSLTSERASMCKYSYDITQPYRFRSARHLYTRGLYTFSSTPLFEPELELRPPRASRASSSSDPSSFPSTLSTPFNFLERPLPMSNRCISSSRSAYRSIRSRCKRADSSFSKRVRWACVIAQYNTCSTEQKKGVLCWLQIFPTHQCCLSHQQRGLSFSFSSLSLLLRVLSNRDRSHRSCLWSPGETWGGHFVSL
jgi:hypothetical protein